MAKFLEEKKGGEFTCNQCGRLFHLTLIKAKEGDLHEVFGKGAFVLSCPFCEPKGCQSSASATVEEFLPSAADICVENVRWPIRVRKTLMRLRIKTLGELTQLSANDLLTSKNFGPTSLLNTEEILESYGLRLREEVTRI